MWRNDNCDCEQMQVDAANNTYLGYQGNHKLHLYWQTCLSRQPYSQKCVLWSSLCLHISFVYMYTRTLYRKMSYEDFDAYYYPVRVEMTYQWVWWSFNIFDDLPGFSMTYHGVWWPNRILISYKISYQGSDTLPGFWWPTTVIDDISKHWWQTNILMIYQSVWCSTTVFDVRPGCWWSTKMVIINQLFYDLPRCSCSTKVLMTYQDADDLPACCRLSRVAAGGAAGATAALYGGGTPAIFCP